MEENMTPSDILNYCLENFEDAILINSWGEKGIFYNPNQKLKRGIYIITIKEKDGEHDKSSNLNREGIYRLNIGVRKETFIKMFGNVPKRPSKGNMVDMNYDFSSISKIIPHPIYAWMGWICILNPSKEVFEKCKPLILEAYEYAKQKYTKRKI